MRKCAGAAEASIDDLDEIVSEEPKHQPHLMSFSDHPAMLEQDWKKSQTMGVGKVMEAASLLTSMGFHPSIWTLTVTVFSPCFHEEESHLCLQRTSRVTVQPKGLDRSGGHHLNSRVQ